MAKPERTKCKQEAQNEILSNNHMKASQTISCAHMHACAYMCVCETPVFQGNILSMQGDAPHLKWASNKVKEALQSVLIWFWDAGTTYLRAFSFC